MKQPGMFIFVNLVFAGLLFVLYFIPVGWEFYAFWFVFYLELAQAAWINSEQNLKIKYEFTYYLMGVALCVLLALSVVEYFFRMQNYLVSLCGFSLCLAAIIIRYYGVKNLGENFSEHVKVPKKLVTTGLYKYVRHPIYTSSFMLVFGLPLVLNSYYALGASVLVSVIIYIRAELEEKELCIGLTNYKEYTKRTGKFIPNLTD